MAKPDWHDMNLRVIEEFRANKGKVGPPFQDADVLLLTSTGARSGEPRLVPLVYTLDGDRWVIIASKAGLPTHPDWYHNLVKHPEAQIEVGEETIGVRALLQEGPERRRLFDAQAEKMPVFKDYEAKAPREIPVFVLERRQG